MPREEGVGAVEVGGVDAHDAAEAVQQRSTAIGANGVGAQGADQAAQGGGGDGGDQEPAPPGERLDRRGVGHQEARKGEDELARHGEARGVHGHGDRHAEVADRLVHARNQGDQDFVQPTQHALIVPEFRPL